MIQAGFYRLDLSRQSWRECMRDFKFRKSPGYLLQKLIGREKWLRSSGGFKYPDPMMEARVEKAQLPLRIQTRLQIAIETPCQQGFIVLGWLRANQPLIPSLFSRTNVILVDPGRFVVMRIQFTETYVRTGLQQYLSFKTETVSNEGRVLVHTDARFYFDPLPGNEIISLPDFPAMRMYRRHLERVNRDNQPSAMRFESLQDYAENHDSRWARVCESRVKTGKMALMNDAEIEKSRHQREAIRQIVIEQLGESFRDV
jgi:hypothetical protein